MMGVEVRPDITLFLCGDVMTGRGIDQVLENSVDPTLYERYVKSALDYVHLAEAVNGPLPRPLSFEYPWGDVLPLLKREAPDLRLINLETAITERGAPHSKCIHYRMHPLNVPCLAALGVDGAVLANNHVLDWGAEGLEDTLASLRQAGIASVGAGRDRAEAEQEAQWVLPGKGRVRLFAFGHPSSGVPGDWAAGETSAGINWLPALLSENIEALRDYLRESRMEGDVVVVSLHWGSNWGYDVPGEQQRFAHALIDEAGVDLVWGHSSHHPRPIEVYRGRLILYGVGDFLNDYEGIGGHEEFRPELAALYLPRLAPDGELRELRLWPLRVHLFRLKRAAATEGHWLAETLSRVGRALGTQLFQHNDGTLRLHWQ
jgi:poly-gamma-glutamate synthesis protein (capsule biosynthesis protein)